MAPHANIGHWNWKKGHVGSIKTEITSRLDRPNIIKAKPRQANGKTQLQQQQRHMELGVGRPEIEIETESDEHKL